MWFNFIHDNELSKYKIIGNNVLYLILILYI